MQNQGLGSKLVELRSLPDQKTFLVELDGQIVQAKLDKQTYGTPVVITKGGEIKIMAGNTKVDISERK